MTQGGDELCNYEILSQFNADRSIALDVVDQYVAQIWDEIRRNPSVVDPHSSLALMNSPFIVGRPTSQFDVATTILVSVVGGLAKDVLSGLYKVYIWPALKRRFGKDVSEA